MLDFWYNFIKGKKIYNEKVEEIHKLKMKKIDNLNEFQIVNNYDTNRNIIDAIYFTYLAVEVISFRSSYKIKKSLYLQGELLFRNSIIRRFMGIFSPIFFRIIIVNQLYYVYFNYFVPMNKLK